MCCATLRQLWRAQIQLRRAQAQLQTDLLAARAAGDKERARRIGVEQREARPI